MDAAAAYPPTRGALPGVTGAVEDADAVVDDEAIGRRGTEDVAGDAGDARPEGVAVVDGAEEGVAAA